eukprot:2087322-Amphidinium_carterae.1
MQVWGKLARCAENCWRDISPVVLGSLLPLLIKNVQVNICCVRNRSDSNVNVLVLTAGRNKMQVSTLMAAPMSCGDGILIWRVRGC